MKHYLFFLILTVSTSLFGINLKTDTPEVVANYLVSEGLPTRGYKNPEGYGWAASSDYKMLPSSQDMANNIAYYCNGTADQVTKVSLVLSVFSQAEADAATASFIQSSSVLCLAVMGKPLPDIIKQTLIEGGTNQWQTAGAIVKVEKEVFPSGKGYGQRFIIQESKQAPAPVHAAPKLAADAVRITAITSGGRSVIPTWVNEYDGSYNKEGTTTRNIYATLQTTSRTPVEGKVELIWILKDATNNRTDFQLGGTKDFVCSFGREAHFIGEIGLEDTDDKYVALDLQFKTGARYQGWLLRAKDTNGQIIGKAASKTAFLQLIDQAVNTNEE